MAMELDIIKTQTTWNDAAASLNNNFSKMKQAIAMGGGGSSDIVVDTEMSDTSTNPVQNKVVKKYIDDEVVYLEGYAESVANDAEGYAKKYTDGRARVLYWADEGMGEALTEEQKAYNAETYTMIRGEVKGAPMVYIYGWPCVYTATHDGDDYIVLTLTCEEIGLIVRYEVELYSDGTIQFPEDRGGMAPAYAPLDEPLSAMFFWMYRDIVPESRGMFLIDDIIYEIDSWGIKDGIPQVEYNEGSKRYRVTFDPDLYSIIDKIDITPTSGGGGSIDQEILEGYLPMMREFSDDFNNDFTR